MKKEKMICATGIILLLSGGIILSIYGRKADLSKAAVIQGEKDRELAGGSEAAWMQADASPTVLPSEEVGTAVLSGEAVGSSEETIGQENADSRDETTGQENVSSRDETIGQEGVDSRHETTEGEAEEPEEGAPESGTSSRKPEVSSEGTKPYGQEQGQEESEERQENVQPSLPSKEQETPKQPGQGTSGVGQNSESLQPQPSESSASPSEGQTQEHTHHYEKVYWYGEPSCSIGNNYYNLVCSECGAFGGDGEDVVAHTPDRRERESYEGCLVYRIEEITCTVCGEELGRETVCIGERHQWTQGVGTPVWSEELQDFVTPSLEYCANCFCRK